jgi:hypothetical protein
MFVVEPTHIDFRVDVCRRREEEGDARGDGRVI